MGAKHEAPGVVGGSDWLFRRHTDGQVEVRCTNGATFLDEFDWSAVIAAMANGRSYQEAYFFHRGVEP